jgi:hypothetical protein
MKNRFYLLLVIGLILAMLPARTTAAPQTARQSFLTVESWNLNQELSATFIKFAANDVNWQVTKAAALEFGFVYCEGDVCEETVDVSLKISPKTYPYPQDLNLAAKDYRYITPSADCSIEQFVRILDTAGVVKKEATNGPYEYCITPSPYPVPYP